MELEFFQLLSDKFHVAMSLVWLDQIFGGGSGAGSWACGGGVPYPQTARAVTSRINLSSRQMSQSFALASPP